MKEDMDTQEIEKNNEANTDVVSVITNQTYFALKEATYLFQVLHRVNSKDFLRLDISPEAKKSLRRDLDFDSNMIRNLTECQRLYKDLEKRLDIMEQEFDKKLIDNKYWDMAMANVHFRIACMMAIDSVTEHSPEMIQRVIEWISSLPVNKDIMNIVNEQIMLMTNLLKRYITKKEDNGSDRK